MRHVAALANIVALSLTCASASGARPCTGCSAIGAPPILSATLVQDGKAVAIRTAKGTQILDPGLRDTAFTGYDDPVVSGDRQSVAWIEEEGMPVSDASYPEPTGVWLFSHGRLIGALDCGSGRPFSFQFTAEGRKVVLACEFPHGPPSNHDVSFDTASGQCLSDLDMQTHQQQPCDPASSAGANQPAK